MHGHTNVKFVPNAFLSTVFINICICNECQIFTSEILLKHQVQWGPSLNVI